MTKASIPKRPAADHTRTNEGQKFGWREVMRHSRRGVFEMVSNVFSRRTRPVFINS